MEIEVEAKFRAVGPEPLEQLRTLARLGPAVLGPARTVDEIDRYLDTRDGRLEAALWACRLRSRDGTWRVSLKGPPSPGTDGSAMHHRPELEGPATADPEPSGWPASDARSFLEGIIRGGPLTERLRLRQRRTERPVAIAGHAGPVALLTLDEVVVEEGGTAAGILHVVELEQARGAGEVDLGPIVAALAGIRGLAPDPLTKLEHALGLLRAR